MRGLLLGLLCTIASIACGSQPSYEGLSDEPFAPFGSRSFKPSLISYNDLMSIEPYINDEGVFIGGQQYSVYYHAEIVEVVLGGDRDQDGNAESYLYRAALFGNEDETVALAGPGLSSAPGPSSRPAWRPAPRPHRPSQAGRGSGR